MCYPWHGETQHSYIPMINFGVVENGLYRSGFPLERNRPFLQHLGIRTLLFLEPKQENATHTKDLDAFCKDHNINFIYSPFDVNKYPSEPEKVAESLSRSLSVVLDKSNYPILIHCLKGQHYTGIFVGCIRRLQQWSLSSIFQEFSHYEKKVRIYDMLIVELFQDMVHVKHGLLPEWAEECLDDTDRIIIEYSVY